MTCIVGVEENGKIHIGGDSAITNYSTIECSRDLKVFIRDGFIFGSTGSIRMKQILKFGDLPPLQDETMSDLYYLTTIFADTIRQQFKDAGFMKIENSVENGGMFLFGYRGRLYCMENDFNIHSSDTGMMAIGSGGEIALGSLYSTTGKPKKRIKTGLRLSAQLTPFVRAPFTILSI